MIKNIIILVLLASNIATGYYIYSHMNPYTTTTFSQRSEQKPAEFYYRIHLHDGGEAEGDGIIRKGSDLDLVDNGRVTMTIPVSNVKKVERVYFKTGRVVTIKGREVSTIVY